MIEHGKLRASALRDPRTTKDVAIRMRLHRVESIIKGRYGKGNGYIRLRFEAEESIHQCKICNSQGEIEEEKEEEQQKFTAGHISSSF